MADEREMERCEMAETVVEDILKPGMTRHDIEEILGAEKPRRIRDDKTVEYDYYLGWCSPIAWDPYFLRVRYDAADILIEADNFQG